ncbi:MAG: SPFH domain-containing protein [Alphaproteobacteria bacterium]|nr:SPFH domain-containing protein [Alphaproteobacteria bacterium]
MELWQLLILLIVVSPIFCIFIVHHQTVVVIERLGKFNRVAYPGLNFMIPFIESKNITLSLRIQQLDLIVETKTHDNVFVKLKIAVQFKVIEEKIYEACYKLYSPAAQIESFVFDVVRAKVPTMELDALFVKKDEIALDVKNQLDDTMKDFGYEIIKAPVTDIEPNENVKHAMNEINTAQRLRMAANEKAEAEKIMKIKQAEGDAEANILHGKGLAGQRMAIIEGLSQSMDLIKQDTPEMSLREIMGTILTIQYFDTLKNLGEKGNTNTLFVSHAPNQANQVQDQFLESLFAQEASLRNINKK